MLLEMRSVFFCLLFLALSGVVLGEDAAPATEVKVKSGVQDEEIESRLYDIFSEVEALQEIQVSVRSGVVTLSGRVPSRAIAEEAVGLVKRTEGVVMTLDRMAEETEVASQLSPALQKLRDMWTKTKVKLPLIGLAIITVFLFVWLGNLFHGKEIWYQRLKVSSLAQNLVRRTVRVVVIGIGVLLALELLDATSMVGAVLGAAGLVGLAVGFAFKNIIENYLSGILLSTRNPFEIGDVIEINGRTGKVAVLTPRDTVLITLDGNHLRIPNSIVINSELLNFTRNPRRRFEFTVGVSVDADLTEARSLALETLRKNPGILADPKPIAFIDSLGDSSVVLKFFAWLDQTKHDFLKTKSESIRLVKCAFDNAEIEMPEPIYRLNLDGVPVAMSASAEAPQELEEKGEFAKPVKEVVVSEEDLAADHSIDEQIEEEKEHSDERNLLIEKSAKTE